jgi:hypothetical protein
VASEKHARKNLGATTGTKGRNMNNSKRQQKQTDKALAKKEVTGEILVPMTKQPEYPVPEDVRELRDAQTADWDLSADIQILRFYIAQETKKGGNAAVVAQLAKAVESLIRTNVSTALRTGEWLSGTTYRELLRAMIDDVAELFREHVPDDDVFSDLFLELKARYQRRTSRENIAAVNERNGNL